MGHLWFAGSAGEEDQGQRGWTRKSGQGGICGPCINEESNFGPCHIKGHTGLFHRDGKHGNLYKPRTLSVLQEDRFLIWLFVVQEKHQGHLSLGRGSWSSEASQWYMGPLGGGWPSPLRERGTVCFQWPRCLQLGLIALRLRTFPTEVLWLAAAGAGMGRGGCPLCLAGVSHGSARNGQGTNNRGCIYWACRLSFIFLFSPLGSQGLLPVIEDLKGCIQ